MTKLLCETHVAYTALIFIDDSVEVYSYLSLPLRQKKKNSNKSNKWLDTTWWKIKHFVVLNKCVSSLTGAEPPFLHCKWYMPDRTIFAHRGEFVARVWGIHGRGNNASAVRPQGGRVAVGHDIQHPDRPRGRPYYELQPVLARVRGHYRGLSAQQTGGGIYRY